MAPGDVSEPRPEDRDVEVGFEREADLLRSLAGGGHELPDAPPDVWAGIEAALADEAATAEADHTAAGNDEPAESPEPAAPVVVLAGRRRRRWQYVAAAAAAIVAIVAGSVLLATRDTSGTRQLAASTLQPVGNVDLGDAKATVRLERQKGNLRLEVEMDHLPPPAPGTFYEMWLLDGGTGTPVSLAEMKEPASHVSTTIDVPAGTDTHRYDVVDVSVQHEGAGPQHSGESILRGTLTA